MNETSLIPRIHTLKFSEIVGQLVEDGQGFATLIGSGISAPSGILMGQEFTDFLGYTVAQVIYEQWDIRRTGWPKYPNKDDVDEARRRLRKTFDEVCERHDAKPFPEFKETDASTFMVKGFQKKNEGPKNGTQKLDEEVEKFQEIHAQLRLGLSVPLIPEILRHPDAYDLEQKRKELYQQLYRRHPAEDWQPPTLHSPSSIEFVQEKAIRSLYDWRATLAFLSSVSSYQFTADQCRPMIVTPDPAVIDSFNVHITRNKKPNLSHLMIARLMRPLRSRVLLTTNFDPLLEDSFNELNEPLQVLEVSSQGRLPSFNTVRAQNCLIKLHGSLSETRADFSLDEPPSEEDKNTFVSYLCGGRRDLRLTTAPSPSTEIGLQHLLVMGYSGRDQRTIQLIKYALDSHPDLKVFWICHTQSSTTLVDKIFTEHSYIKDGRISLTVTDRPDLLLYELYQKITRSLPGGGFSFQYSPNVPPEYAPAENTEEERVANPGIASVIQQAETDVEEIKEYISRFADERRADLAPYIIASGNGVVARMTVYFDNSKGSRLSPLWLELEDYVSPAALLFEILQIMALKLGYYQLDHVKLLPRDLSEYEKTGAYIQAITEYLGITPANWPIFLYGRNGAGGCAGFAPKYWGESEYLELKEFMDVLVKQGFPVVYFPYDEDRKFNDLDNTSGCRAITEKILSEIEVKPAKKSTQLKSQGAIKREKNAFKKFRKEWPEAFTITPDATIGKTNNVWRSPAPPYSYEFTVRQVISFGHGKDWQKGGSSWLSLPADLMQLRELAPQEIARKIRQLQFLYALTLFRQSRHATALVSDATYQCPHQFNLCGQDNDKERYDQVDKWVARLQQTTFLLTKPGGYNWCFRDMRLGIQFLLEELTNIPALPAGPVSSMMATPISTSSLGTSVKPHYDFLGQTRSRTHFWIGNWYQKTFASTGHYLPLVEALFHYIEAARYASFSKPAGFTLGISSHQKKIERHRRTLLLNSLNETGKTLRLGRDALKFWLSGVDRPKISPDFLDGLKSHIEKKETLERLGVQDMSDGSFQSILKTVSSLRNEFESISESLKSEGGNTERKIFLPPVVFENAEAIPKDELLQVPDNESPIDKFRKFFGNAEGDSQKLEEVLGHGELLGYIESYLSPNKRSISDVTSDVISASAKLSESVRTWRAKVSETLVGDSGNEQALLYKLIWGLSELAYSYTQKAKEKRFNQILTKPMEKTSEFIFIPRIEECVDEKKEGVEKVYERKWCNTIDPEDEEVLKHWVVVSVLCWTCIELCRSLHPQFAEHETTIKIKCNSLYGLALSYLNRFSEAHRRLNEAHALIPRGRSGLRSHDLACLHLRRAEVHLNQAEREWPKENRTWAKFFAHVDDGWVSLERAEAALSGSSHSSLWWGQLYSLKLRTYSLFDRVTQAEPPTLRHWELAVRTMPFRRRIQYDESVRQIVKRALLTFNDNCYRRLRVCWYYEQIVRAFQAMKVPGVCDLKLCYKPILGVAQDPQCDSLSPEFIKEYKGRLTAETSQRIEKFADLILAQTGCSLTKVKRADWEEVREQLRDHWNKQKDDEKLLPKDDGEILNLLDQVRKHLCVRHLIEIQYQKLYPTRHLEQLGKLTDKEWKELQAKVKADWKRNKDRDNTMFPVDDDLDTALADFPKQ